MTDNYTTMIEGFNSQLTYRLTEFRFGSKNHVKYDSQTSEPEPTLDSAIGFSIKYGFNLLNKARLS